MAHQVFISYASADKAVADSICAALESAAVPCWIAPRNIEPGVHYPSAIMDAVSTAKIVVLVLSDTAQASPHVVTEVEEAFNKRKRIVPFRLSRAPLSKELDYFLSLSQWLDAPDGATAANLAKLTAAVKEAAPWPGPGPRTRPVKALISLTIVVVAGLAYWMWPRSLPPVSSPPVVEAPPPKLPAPETGVPKIRTAGGLDYVWIPPGSFTMGCSPGDSECADDEKPTHPVEIEKGFWMAKTEVTVAASIHSETPGKDGNMPAREKSWAEAKQYCASVGGRLPTEAEWEYAARGGKTEAVYGAVPKIAWYAGNSSGGPHPAGQMAPNAYGLYDMLGNVAEWVLDRYYNRYDIEAPATGPKVEQPLASNAEAAIRGGFWESPAESIRVSRRASRPPDDPAEMVGFRCVIDP